MTLQDPAPDQPSSRRWWVLTAMVLGVAMAMLDNLALTFALPSLQQALGAGASDLRWFVDAYTLAFASLMLFGGWLGDLYGRKRFFAWGLILFTLGSLSSGLSQSPGQLVLFRALQGLGAAVLLPGSLSILAATFVSRGRGAAMGIWAAVSGLAVAAGPPVGTYIVEHHSWNWVFFINIPVALLALLLTLIFVKESKDRASSRRINVPGILTGTAGILFLVYALIGGPSNGWTDELVLGSFGLAAVLLIAFLIIDATWKSPMLPLSLFRNPTFVASNVVSATVFFVLFGSTLFLAQYLQNEQPVSSVETWVQLLPFTAAVLVMSPIGGRISDRRGSQSLMTLGCALAAGGLALLVLTEVDVSYFTVILPASIVLGTGLGLTLGPMTTAVMGSAELRHAGVASAATNTFREVGGVLGIALLSTVGTAAFKNRLLTSLVAGGIATSDAQSIVDKSPSIEATAGSYIESLRRQMPVGSPGELTDRVVNAARQSFVESLHSATLIAIGFMLLAAVVAAIFVRSHVRTEDQVRRGPVFRREDDVVPRAAEEVGAGSASYRKTEDTPVGSASFQDEGQPKAEPSSKEPPQELKNLLFELPFKAGEGTVHQNLAEFLQGILRYQQDGFLSDAGGATLPPGVAGNLQGTTSPEIAVVSGYLLLEQRFGRISEQTHPEQAATLLIGAARGLSLWTLNEDDPAVRQEFVEGMVRIVLEGIGTPNVGAIQPLESSNAGQDSLPGGNVVRGEIRDSEVLELPEVPAERDEEVE